MGKGREGKENNSGDKGNGDLWGREGKGNNSGDKGNGRLGVVE